MNDYREVRIDATPCNETITDILAQFLSEANYESFVADENGLTAYIKNELFDSKEVEMILNTFPIDGIEFRLNDIFVEGRDWNSEWEKNYFKPIVVGDQCVIHSSFHTGYPQCRYDIVIDPKMAFGTGHHQTTSLIISRLLSGNIENMSVIDMGTGTGILAILAAMRGAGQVTAIEIDPAAHINAVDNVAINGHNEIEVLLGDASLLENKKNIDLFIANINRNIITNDLEAYAHTLKKGGTMLLSGFYTEDVDIIMETASKFSLEKVDVTERDRWACLKLVKQ